MRISDWSSDVCSSDLSARHVDVYRINVIDIVRVVVDSFRYPPKRFHANTSFIRLGLAPSRGSGRNEMVADEDNIRRRFQRLHGLTERPLQPFDRSLQGAEFVASRQHLAIVLSEATCIRSQDRSEEHTSELQSLMRISYAVFCLKKKKVRYITNTEAK